MWFDECCYRKIFFKLDALSIEIIPIEFSKLVLHWTYAVGKPEFRIPHNPYAEEVDYTIIGHLLHSISKQLSKIWRYLRIFFFTKHGHNRKIRDI